MTKTAITRRPLARRSTIALSVLAIVAIPALSGCFSGIQATTSAQATMNTGNGAQTLIGDIKILDATIVMGDSPADAMLIGTIANVGVTPDSLNSIEVDGKPVTASPAFPELKPGDSVPFGYVTATIKVPVQGLTGPVSTYVPVTFNLQNAGTKTIQVLTVPAVGFYEGIVPMAGVVAPAAAPEPSPSASE
ncbi:MAG: hypothetical protein WC005_03470 [Candidatus Nanopelagicales bacterium]